MDLGPAIRIEQEVALTSPILIAAFRGWNDAGESATFAAHHLARVWGAEQIASIDPEEFYDFQAVRPQVELTEGFTRKITWPANHFLAARLDAGGSAHDVVLLIGTEPSHRWRTFSSLIVEVAKSLGTELVITLGALLADVPHSRPVSITGTAGDEALADRLGLARSRYEGPTGIVGVLHEAFHQAGIGSVSLWAAVPHYLAVTPNPKAVLALVHRVVELVGAGADIDELDRAAQAYEERVSEIVASDEDVEGYVRLLEERADERSEDEPMQISDLPSGDALAAELERFLRERGE